MAVLKQTRVTSCSLFAHGATCTAAATSSHVYVMLQLSTYGYFLQPATNAATTALHMHLPGATAKAVELNAWDTASCATHHDDFATPSQRPPEDATTLEPPDMHGDSCGRYNAAGYTTNVIMPNSLCNIISMQQSIPHAMPQQQLPVANMEGSKN